MTDEAGHRAHSGRSPAARPRARFLDRGELRLARLSPRARFKLRLALSKPARRSRQGVDLGVRRARRRPGDALRRAVGREPAKGHPRPRDRARPTRADRRPADARARRRRDRVRPSAADRGARRGPGDPARLARARRDPLALRPDPRHLRGRDRRRVRPGRDRGRARPGDGRSDEAGRAQRDGRARSAVAAADAGRVDPFRADQRALAFRRRCGQRARDDGARLPRRRPGRARSRGTIRSRPTGRSSTEPA